MVINLWQTASGQTLELLALTLDSSKPKGYYYTNTNLIIQQAGKPMLSLMMQTEISKVIEQHHHDIIFGYLFGSQAKGLANESSDIDIAIFVNPESKDSFFDIKIDFYMDMSRTLKRNDIDIVILNQCKNLILMNEIISHGILIYDSNKQLRQDFEQKILHSAIDFKYQRRMAMGV